MSNKPFRIFYVLVVVVIWLLCMAIVTCAPSTVKRPSKDDSFPTVNDRPVVDSFDQYHDLVQKGRTTITVDGRSYDVFWGDFSSEEKQNLQLRLRIP